MSSSTSTTTNNNNNKSNTSRIPTPWSKQHKKLTKASSGGLSYSLSNSFAQPLTTQELIQWSLERGDQAIVDEYQNHSLEYTANGGSDDLKEAIAGLYDSNISAENILVFPGAQVALQTVHRVLCHPHMHAITFTPGYQSVVAGPAYAGAGGWTQIPLQAETGWQINVEQVRRAIREDTTYMVINQPYNPAGTLMSRTTQQELIALAEQHGIYILCDEVYRWLEHNDDNNNNNNDDNNNNSNDDNNNSTSENSIRLPAMAEVYQRGLSCVTLSKPWGACGISIGWIATQDLNLLDQLSDGQYFGTACPSRASELQAMMCLRESDRILDRNLKIIHHNKRLLQQFMNDYAEWFTWVPPTAGAIAAIRFLGDDTTMMMSSSQQLGDALAAEGIGIKPAYCFNEAQDITRDNDYFRVGFGESKMPAALEALRDFVERHKAQWLAEKEQQGS